MKLTDHNLKSIANMILLFCFIFSVTSVEMLPTKSKSLPSSEYYFSERCFYQIDMKMFYGECMSTNGPDGCCLEGHYQPGICSNLGHLCCTKPDPDCQKMRHNKAIARLRLKQQREHFKLMAKQEDSPAQSGILRRLRRSTEQMPQPVHSRVNFEIVEMPAYMQLDPISFVSEALTRYNGDLDEAAYYLCQMLDRKYPEHGRWACVVGRDFEYSVDAAPGKYLLFNIGQIARIQVMAFVAKSDDKE